MVDFSNTPRVRAEDVGVIPLSPAINCHYGSTSKLIEKSTGESILVLVARKGSWNIRLGDHSLTGDNTMPTAYLAGAAVTNGTAGFPIAEGERLSLYAPSEMTIKAYAADSELVYWYE